MNEGRRGRFVIRAGDPSVHHLTGRLCRLCGEPATFVEEEVQRVVTISRSGKVLENDLPHHTYWCGQHTGII